MSVGRKYRHLFMAIGLLGSWLVSLRAEAGLLRLDGFCGNAGIDSSPMAPSPMVDSCLLRGSREIVHSSSVTTSIRDGQLLITQSSSPSDWEVVIWYDGVQNGQKNHLSPRLDLRGYQSLLISGVVLSAPTTFQLELHSPGRTWQRFLILHGGDNTVPLLIPVNDLALSRVDFIQVHLKGSFGGQFRMDDLSFCAEPSCIPEPRAGLMAGIGLGLAFLWRFLSGVRP